MQPDHAFDSYHIRMWEDLGYRVERQHTSHRSQAVVHYLARGAGGEFIWADSADRASTWTTVQNSTISLAEALTQHGVIG